jgi:hypothetical protein
LGGDERGLAVVRVLRGGLAEATADEALGVLERRRVVLVRVDPGRVADVVRERRARLERLLRSGRRAPACPASWSALSWSYVSAMAFCDVGGGRVHRPLLEHELVDLDGVVELVEAPELEGERAVDLDRPGLVLGDERSGP